jgi:hypothetical protein
MRLDRVVGVDFSAAERDAGRKTWIADADVTGDGLELGALSDVETRFERGAARRETLDGLVEYVTGLDGRSAVGLDFPFSLPRSLLVGDDWREFVAATPGEWGRLDGVESPRDLYDAATARAEAEELSLHRETDRARGGQEPTGFRITTQTYYGISEVLKGIVHVGGDVVVAPFDDWTDSDTVVVEAYPAATFERLGGARTGYKRDTVAGIEARRENVKALRDAGVRVAEDELDDFAVATDDALDAVAAAVAAWEAAKDDFSTGGTESTVEGYIYV